MVLLVGDWTFSLFNFELGHGLESTGSRGFRNQAVLQNRPKQIATLFSSAVFSYLSTRPMGSPPPNQKISGSQISWVAASLFRLLYPCCAWYLLHGN